MYGCRQEGIKRKETVGRSEPLFSFFLRSWQFTIKAWHGMAPDPVDHDWLGRLGLWAKGMEKLICMCLRVCMYFDIAEYHFGFPEGVFEGDCQ